MEPAYRKLLVKFLLCFFSAGVFLSCGIDEYYYLNPVPTGNIQVTLNERATIQLPGVSANYFTHFTIFYRIYISDYAAPGQIQTSSTELSRINSALTADYAAIEPYTTNNTTTTNTNTSSASTLFRNRNYQVLTYHNAQNGNTADDVISAQNTTLLIDFPITAIYPYLTFNDNVWDLYRSTGNGSYSPVPNRYFLNYPELNNSANASSTVNGDVANNSVSGKRYTYISLYIVTTGLDQQTYTPIYSIPTHIGIFLLPDPTL
ncbi:hypothetical protein AGMMS49546_30340 [Spirochaetia bacterium]|nr:hypothetical protein AGMMS49546_30340 [Spirochaetia bacterium]